MIGVLVVALSALRFAVSSDPALVRAASGGENRLWLVELELRGGCEAVRLDCGADGETLLSGPFAAGEDRRLLVPVPVRSPLGAAGLAALPLPRAEALPEPSSAAVRVLGFAAEQPAVRLERALGALLARPRPPAASARARAGWAELLLVVLAGGALLRLRRRLLFAFALAAGAGTLVLLLARSRAPVAAPVELVEWEAGSERALSVRSAPDELALGAERLEVEPAGRPLELRVGPDGEGAARARGARLAAFVSAAAPDLAPLRNGHGRLDAVWTRTAAGTWREHGPWEPGAPLGAPLGDGTAPPGWLASALPPGRAVLVARTSGGVWLRCVGFEAG